VTALTNTPWSIPFVVALAGEYVIEILGDIHAGLANIDRQLVAAFFQENPDLQQRTYDRVMSYWNCYWRWQYQRADYPGFKLLAAFGVVTAGGKNSLSTVSSY
jgi:hypothetical protein